MTVKFSNGIEVQSRNTFTGWAWRQDYTRAWFAIPEEHPLVQAAVNHLRQRYINRTCHPEDERDQSRCLC